MSLLLPEGTEVPPEPSLPPTTCPAARAGQYADSGRAYIYCGVERKHFAVVTSPLAALGWCCGSYQTCPVWRAAHDEPGAVKKVHEAQDKEAAQQAEKGLRQPDIEDEIKDLEDELRAEREQIAEDRRNGRDYRRHKS